MSNPETMLTEFKATLSEIYGARLERVILFGSRARGDARPHSDYDIAVFLKDYSDRWAESDNLADAAAQVMSKTGAFIHAMPYRAAQYDERSPLMHEIRCDGREI